MASRQKQILLITILVAVLLRMAAAVYLGNKVEALPGTFDQVSYHNLAERVLGGYSFTFGKFWWPATAPDAPTAHWSYLYTAYLIIVYAIFGPNPLVARLIQALFVGILQPYLAFLIGRRLFGSVAGLAAAMLTAFYTYFIYYAATLMTESFYILAILASLYFGIQLAGLNAAKQADGEEQRGNKWKLAAFMGISLGAAVLLRQLYLLFVPFLFLWVWLTSRRRQFASLLVSGAILVACILPITAFNYARFQRFVLLNTNAGFAFFWANHPIYGTHFEPILPNRLGSYLDLIPPDLLSQDEAALDQSLLRRGIQFVLDDPGRYALLSLSRIPPYFQFWPSGDSELISNLSRVAGFGLLLPFMIYGLYRSYPREKGFQLAQPVMLLYLFMLVYTLIHVLTWTLIRYRLPVDAALLLFAGLAVFDLADRAPVLRKVLRAMAL